MDRALQSAWTLHPHANLRSRLTGRAVKPSAKAQVGTPTSAQLFLTNITKHICEEAEISKEAGMHLCAEYKLAQAQQALQEGAPTLPRGAHIGGSGAGAGAAPATLHGQEVRRVPPEESAKN